LKSFLNNDRHLIDLIQAKEISTAYIEALTPEEITSSTVLNIDFNIIEPEDYPDYATRTIMAMNAQILSSESSDENEENEIAIAEMAPAPMSSLESIFNRPLSFYYS
jgi:hypothetical protein